MSEPGHNSGVAREQLRAIVDRIIWDTVFWSRGKRRGDFKGLSEIVAKSLRNCLGKSSRDTNRAFLLASVHLGWDYEFTKRTMRNFLISDSRDLDLLSIHPEKSGFVYFAAYPENGEMPDFRFIKIGFSRKPHERIKQLRKKAFGQELELINVFPALMIHEHELHILLREYHSGGEIFRITDDLYDEMSKWEAAA